MLFFVKENIGIRAEPSLRINLNISFGFCKDMGDKITIPWVVSRNSGIYINNENMVLNSYFFWSELQKFREPNINWLILDSAKDALESKVSILCNKYKLIILDPSIEPGELEIEKNNADLGFETITHLYKKLRSDNSANQSTPVLLYHHFTRIDTATYLSARPSDEDIAEVLNPLLEIDKNIGYYCSFYPIKGFVTLIFYSIGKTKEIPCLGASRNGYDSYYTSIFNGYEFLENQKLKESANNVCKE